MAAPAFSPLDYSRFIPVSMDVIMHPDAELVPGK